MRRWMYISLQKLNGCFDLAVVILVAVLSDTQDVYQFRVGIGMLKVTVIIISNSFQLSWNYITLVTI